VYLTKKKEEEFSFRRLKLYKEEQNSAIVYSK